MNYRIRDYISKYWYLYLIAIACMVISILLDVIAPQITKRIIDDVIVGGQQQLLMSLLFGFLGIGFGRAILQYAKEFIFDITSFRTGCNIRKNLFDHIQTLSMRYFDSHNTGELMVRVKDDVDRVWNGLGFVGMLVIECLIHTVIVLFCMVKISSVLTWIPLLIMPIMIYAAIRMERELGAVYDLISEETAELNTVAQENLAGVKTIKAFAREDHEIEKFRRHNKRFYELNMKQASYLTKYQPNILFLTNFLLMAVIIGGGILVITGKLSIGELGAFSEYTNNIIWPMGMIGWLSNDVAAAMASNKKINKVLCEKPEIQNQEDPVIPDVVEGRLSFSHVDFSLNQTDILKDISFTLEPGKTLGIMGMTGSGKSSIVNLVQRFYDSTAGQITLDGIDIKNISLASLRSSVSVVMQDVFLFSNSVLENIEMGKSGRMEHQEVEEAAVSAGAHSFISKLSNQYNTVVGERGVGLSGGQKQRISIARAIAKHTAILILDDSTSALDMETEHRIQDNLNRITDSAKIIIGHRISAVRHADEIIILKQGRIVERGTHDELMKQKGQYYRTYQVQYTEEVESCQ